MIDSVDKDTLVTWHNGIEGPKGGASDFLLSCSGCLAGILGFSQAYEVVSKGDGSCHYLAAHHPEF